MRFQKLDKNFAGNHGQIRIDRRQPEEVEELRFSHVQV